ncbi:nitrous oxide reductase accessory protein NosL [Cytobacillus suaedae]|nr:nitrous oxide reductase accessory protein NosL [Cytobacillus suaedae]
MRKLVSLVVTLLFISACSNSIAKPVSVSLNVDSCDTCHMGIMDLQASAQLIQKDGTPKKFDDIGCLVEYMQLNPSNNDNAFVHDHISGEWIDFKNSTFIHNPAHHTPMSYGFIAFKSEDEATSYKNQHGGMMYSHEELLDLSIKDIKKKGPNHGH